MSLATRVLGALSIPVLTLPLAAVPAEAAVKPPPSKSLPAGLDVAAPYQAQRTCDPTPKPGVLAFATLMSAHYGVGTAAWGISRNCNSGVTEHSEGRAWDWMLNSANPQQKAIADSVTAWLSAPDRQGRPGAMARRFGINYIIWNRRMWRAYAPERGWASYSGSSPHTDHVHFSFTWDGARKRTSWWTGRPVTSVDPGPQAPPPAPAKPPSSYPTLRVGSSGPDVALAQRVVGATADGQFGPQTQALLLAWQRAHGVPATGVLDPATWARMVALRAVPARGAAAPAPAPTPIPTPPAGSTAGPALSTYYSTTLRRGSRGAAVSALQRALRIAADGDFGPKTEASVRAFQSSHRLTVTGVVTTPTWRALAGERPTPATPPASGSAGGASRPASPLPTTSSSTPYTALMGTVLRTGSRGNAVKTLQRALGGVAVDGAYGARTAAAVAAFQRSHGLKATGVTDGGVWRALQARDYPLLAYRSVVLKRGSTGPAVQALQRALRIAADGRFGPATEAAVKAAQGRAHLARTGVVAAQTWLAIEAQLRH